MANRRTVSLLSLAVSCLASWEARCWAWNESRWKEARRRSWILQKEIHWWLQQWPVLPRSSGKLVWGGLHSRSKCYRSGSTGSQAIPEIVFKSKIHETKNSRWCFNWKNVSNKLKKKQIFFSLSRERKSVSTNFLSSLQHFRATRSFVASNDEEVVQSSLLSLCFVFCFFCCFL